MKWSAGGIFFVRRGKIAAGVGKEEENTHDVRRRGGGIGMNLADISDRQWTVIMNRLTLHADNKLRRLIWRGVPGLRGGIPAGGIRAEDLAAEAIVDLLEGRRVWNATRDPDLLNWLRDVVDSKVSHLVECKENRGVAQVAASATCVLEAQEAGVWKDSFPSNLFWLRHPGS